MPSFEHQSYTWFAARARNALRRRMATSIVGSLVFITALIGLVLIPRQASKTARAVQTRTASRPDTAPVLAARGTAVKNRAQADTVLSNARHAAATTQSTGGRITMLDTFPPEIRAERDSLNSLLRELNGAMSRAEASPLPPAFRALAQTRALQENSGARQLLDSLNRIDKLREPFGALGAGDPIYVTLTAHVNEIGRSIRDAAMLRRSELRARIAPLLPAPAPPSIIEARIDTGPIFSARNDAQRTLVLANQALQQMREQNMKIDAELARARNLANLGAPPIAMLAAALVLALVLAFTWAFAMELRRPRLAHLREAEAVAGARVLAVIRPVEIVERSRRQSDVATPPLIDIVSDSYRKLYLHLAATGASIPTITITGEIIPIVATVASNLAAISAYEARTTLLVDTDSATNDVAGVFRISPEPGLTEVMLGKSDWIQSIQTITVGRDRPLDVLPGGKKHTGEIPFAGIDRVREDLLRMERRYDFVVLSAAPGYVEQATNTVIPTQDVILCARLGQTRLQSLRATVRALEGVGRNIHGLVLWDAEIPRINHHHG